MSSRPFLSFSACFVEPPPTVEGEFVGRETKVLNGGLEPEVEGELLRGGPLFGVDLQETEKEGFGQRG